MPDPATKKAVTAAYKLGLRAGDKNELQKLHKNEQPLKDIVEAAYGLGVLNQ